MDRGALKEWVRDARARSFELLEGLREEQLRVPQLDIINPFIWEVGHVAWFQEKWVLREGAGRAPIRDDADDLWDSIAIPHDDRWELPLPSEEETYRYMRNVRDRVLQLLESDDADERIEYLTRYTVHHEDMHTEAFTYTRQTLGYPAPSVSLVPEETAEEAGAGPAEGDVEVPGGVWRLGAERDDPRFAFDNEKWAHPVELEPFRISRAPVTRAQFAEFVEDGGYSEREYWSEEGWAWCREADARGPLYWRRDDSGAWERRHFDRWVPLEPHRPVIHVNWYEANAWCRWAGRRLPTEAEWEAAAAGEPDGSGGLAPRKRRWPWGDEERPTPGRVNADWRAMGCVDVAARPAGDSAFGCQQMLGNVWEWTASPFEPFPGFEPDMYREYSQPWFGDRKVLRGGAWPTRSRLMWNGFRNFYTPDRRDVWAGFRTCAAD